LQSDSANNLNLKLHLHGERLNPMSGKAALPQARTTGQIATFAATPVSAGLYL
jgi:hypothetical protein